MQLKEHFKRATAIALAVGCLGQPLPAMAGLLDISDLPLALDVRAIPNVLFLVDDGATMDFEVMTRDALNAGIFSGTQPDGTSPAGTGQVRHRDDNDDGQPDCAFARDGQTFNGYIYGVMFPGNTYPSGGGTNCNIADDQEWRFRNSDFNVLYFNPNKTYKPWPGLDAAGNPFQDMPITAAKDNPADTNSPTVDLTKENSKRQPGDGYGFRYYTWTDKDGDGLFDDGEETEHLIRDADTTTKQNFANWFSYHRRRSYAAKAAYGPLIATARDMRMGLVTFHNNGGSNTPIRLMNTDPTTGDKRSLLSQLYSYKSQGNKPLRASLNQVGQYLECDSGNGLFNQGECPALSATDGGTCQQNFVLLMTDGAYDDSFSTPLLENADGDKNTAFDGGAYADKWVESAADVAMHYYERDLHPSLDNNVPTVPGVDDATHQHMVTYVVTFGVNGTLTSMPPNNTDPFSWPNPNPPNSSKVDADAAKIDDLRHAAYNGRGEFLRAQNPDELAEALKSALNSVAVRASSAASVALNSGSYNDGTRIYQARFLSGDWSGQLLSIPVNPNGTLKAPAWDAGVLLNGVDDTRRVVLTYSPTNRDGVPFQWGSLDAVQQTTLNTSPATGLLDLQGQARLQYLRGSRANEGTGNSYRVRKSTLLGDLINSAPFFISPPLTPDGFNTPFDSSTGYPAFRTAYANRTPMVAVGANDGMLHIFHAQTGQELLAYVPNAVFSHLPKLTNPLYRHRYYVDGAPSVGDVQVNGAWRTVLVSGLRAGGQGYFALDVTNPANFTDAQAANVVMWEFIDANDADLGLTFSQPSLVLMANGQWAAVFGNGYNNTLADAHVSTTGHAVLYIAFLNGGLDGVWTPGTDFIKISTQVGEITTPNGLSTPTPVDVDGDFKTDYIVAGDIRGNVWTFDVHDPNPGNWKAAYTDSSGKPTPLFTAKNASGVAQPIVSRPEVGQHPDRLDGFVVYVGTGKYLGSSDINDATVQTFYGVWDNLTGPLASPARTSLLRQTAIGEVTINGQQARITSDNEIDWTLHRGWYIDLPDAGERQVSDSILRNGRIIFTTLIPNTAVCTFGGTGWLMELDVRGGRRLEFASFDFTQDQQFTDADLASVNIDGSDVRVAASGLKSSQGIIPTPSVLSAGNVEFKFASGSEGGIFVAGEHPGPRASGRIAWKQRR